MSKKIAIIPARGGSKRIPRKNIKDFLGKPLISYSIKTALKSKLFENVYVTSDDDEILKISTSYGAKPLLRPKKLADDFCATFDVISNAIKRLRDMNVEFDYVCTIYATAPFIQVKFLQEGYEKLKNSTALYSFAATTFEYPIWRGFEIDNNRCKMFFPQNFHKRSQDLKEAYHDAGWFYWQKADANKDFSFDAYSIPIIVPRYMVQDFDTQEDWIRAERLYKISF